MNITRKTKTLQSASRNTHYTTLRTLLVSFLTIGLLTIALPISAKGTGQSNVNLANHGWLCIEAGPLGWVHCFPPGAFSSSLTIPVKVFDSIDTAVDGEYLGIELLIHDSVFQGQPCTQDGGEYDFENDPYWACHFFDRSN